MGKAVKCPVLAVNDNIKKRKKRRKQDSNFQIVSMKKLLNRHKYLKLLTLLHHSIHIKLFGEQKNMHLKGKYEKRYLFLHMLCKHFHKFDSSEWLAKTCGKTVISWINHDSAVSIAT